MSDGWGPARRHWPALFAALLVVALSLGPTHSIDLWIHLAVGRQIVTQGAIPTTDSFSHTAAGAPFVAHEWLSQVIFYWLYLLGGKPAMVALKTVLGLAAFALLYVLAFWRSREPLVGGGLVVMAALCARYSLDYRPMMLSLVFFAGLLLLLEHMRKRPMRLLWWVVVCVAVFCVWINLHSVAVAGLMVMLVLLVSEAVCWWAGVGERDEQANLLPLLAAGLPAAAVGCCLNPRGWQALAYPLRLGTSDLALKEIVEWFSPNFQDWQMRPFEVMLLLGLVLLVLPRARRRVSDICLLVAFAHASLISQRHSALFAPIAVGVYAGLSAQAVQDLRSLLTGPWGRTAWAGLGVTLALPCVVYSWAAVPKRDLVDTAMCMRYLPVEAIDYIKRERPRGQVFNVYTWGGYLMFFAPEIPVFVDGRTDVYEGQPFRDYQALVKGRPGWRRRLDRYDVGFALLKPDSWLRVALRESDDWRETYVDEVAVVVVREGAPAQGE
ncbi:MAG: hypothetical protein ACE5R4_07645 [Armatimonadota bacterium]